MVHPHKLEAEVHQQGINPEWINANVSQQN